MIRVTAWNNGAHNQTGSGYGLKIAREDRDRYFDKSWSSIFITLPDLEYDVEINIAKELIINIGIKLFNQSFIRTSRIML